ncbi:MAG TPA: beta-propeller fold lactonase family protein [Candidatus Sulfotelmatobacter sp.]|nr:beta-propeller fold lactonase family protein [Candidatus Sulfotelmatobacter sp.]
MRKKAAALFVVCASLATSISCGRNLSHFVYVATPAANQIAAYREDPNSGILTALAGSPIPAGNGVEAIAFHPSKKFLYAANSLESDISIFSVSPFGVITEKIPAGGRTPVRPGGTNPKFLAIDAAGNFLYVGNIASNNISVFSIDVSSGLLTQIQGSPFPIGMTPLNLALAPSGNVLYVTGSGFGPQGIIQIFSLSNGVLSPIEGPLVQPGRSPVGLVIDPTGSFLYTANVQDNTVSGYTIAANGSLTLISGFPVGGTLTGPDALLVDPSGKYLFVANGGSNNMAAFSISAASSGQTGGALTLLGNSPFGTDQQPNFIAADRNGKYVFVGNQVGPAIQSFSLDPGTGTLTLVASYSVGNTPSSIVVAQ